MGDERRPTDEDLARAAKHGDAASYDLLVRRYLRPAMALAWQYTRRVEDAEDVVQEAFHRTVRSLHDYDEGRSFSAWFYTIVRNAAKTAIAKAARRSALAPTAPIEQEPVAPEAFDPILVADLERTIEALAPMQQACVRLCDIEGFTSSEAAAMLGIVEETVRTHLHRARARLRAAIAASSGG